VRSWRWLWVRIVGLLSVPPVILFVPDGRQLRIPQTRLALALEPPDLETGPQERPGGGPAQDFD
jgi:hypothetical protein